MSDPLVFANLVTRPGAWSRLTAEHPAVVSASPMVRQPKPLVARLAPECFQLALAKPSWPTSTLIRWIEAEMALRSDGTTALVVSSSATARETSSWVTNPAAARWQLIRL